MKRKTLPIFLLLLSMLFVNVAQATTFRSQASAAWDLDATWDQGSVPGMNDTVIIDGHSVLVNVAVDIAHLTLTNATGPTHGELIIDGSNLVVFSVSGDIDVTAGNYTKSVDLQVKGNAILNVIGSINYLRTSDNIQTQICRLYMYGNSETYVGENFNYSYENSGQGENSHEIYIDDNALLSVTGKTTLLISGGNSLTFFMQDSSKVLLNGMTSVIASGGKKIEFHVSEYSTASLKNDVILTNSGASEHAKILTDYNGGNIIMEKAMNLSSSADGINVILESNGPNSQIEVMGNLNINAVADSTAYVNILNESQLYLGGNIDRPNNFGNLVSDNNGELILNGSTQQILPTSNTEVADMDRSEIGKITFANTSGEPILLGGDVVFTDTLFMLTGNIISTDAAMMIIGPGAAIAGASKDAYIQGPIKKLGNTGGKDFLFPIGNETHYSPLRISAVSNDNSEYLVEVNRLEGDPPPFGENKAIDVQTTNDSIYWTVTRNENSDPVEVTLYWEDNVESDVDFTDDLIVIGTDESKVWQNLGNGDESLTNPGFVTSLMLGDPPPFGENHYSIGTAPSGSLPVELMNFQAIQQEDEVYLEWNTASEFNTSHFILERSTDKENFFPITTLSSFGDLEFSMKYAALDNNPANGMNYYRLKIVDLDNSFEYSHVEVVEFEDEPIIVIYPNPVAEMLQVAGLSTRGPVSVEVFDRNGLLLYYDLVSTNEGTFEIPTDNINVHVPGTYFLRITSAAQSKIVKFLKVE